jgi:hypothetical protein
MTTNNLKIISILIITFFVFSSLSIIQFVKAQTGTEQIINGGFENGLTGWTGQGIIVTTPISSGTYALGMNQATQEWQYFSTPILTDNVVDFSFLADASDSYCSLWIEINYVDNSCTHYDVSLSIGIYSAYDITGVLVSGEYISSIEFFTGAESDNVYIDGVSLTANMPVVTPVSQAPLNGLPPSWIIWGLILAFIVIIIYVLYITVFRR